MEHANGSSRIVLIPVIQKRKYRYYQILQKENAFVLKTHHKHSYADTLLPKINLFSSVLSKNRIHSDELTSVSIFHPLMNDGYIQILTFSFAVSTPYCSSLLPPSATLQLKHFFLRASAFPNRLCPPFARVPPAALAGLKEILLCKIVSFCARYLLTSLSPAIPANIFCILCLSSQADKLKVM